MFYQCAYLYNILIKRNMATDKGNNSRSHIWHWQKEKIEVALQTWIWVRVDLWPDSFLGCSVITEFSGHVLKSHSSKLSVAISKNPLVVNIICVRTFCCTHVITSTKFRLKWTFQLTKVITETKYDPEQKGETSAALQTQQTLNVNSTLIYVEITSRRWSTWYPRWFNNVETTLILDWWL